MNLEDGKSTKEFLRDTIYEIPKELYEDHKQHFDPVPVRKPIEKKVEKKAKEEVDEDADKQDEGRKNTESKGIRFTRKDSPNP